MKAVVKYSEKPMDTQLRDIPVPEIGRDDVLVEVAYTGICGTDPHLHKGTSAFKFVRPFVLGHEFAGTIVSTGSDVTGFTVGDRVTSETHADYCGKCVLCRTNNYPLCRDRKGYGFHVDGAFTRYVKVPRRILHHVPDNVSLKAASITEPFCVAYKSMISNSTINPGDVVVIIGPGAIGILGARLAQLSGAGEIIMVGTEGDDARLKLSGEFGATVLINSSAEDPLKKIMSIGDGYGANLVVDLAGGSSTLKLSMDAVRPAGQITKIGWGREPVGFSLDPLIAKSVTFRGHFSHTWDVWEKCLALMGKGMIDLEKIITHELGIDQWEKGFDLLESREAVKVVLKPV